MTDQQRIKELEALVYRLTTDLSNMITITTTLVTILSKPPIVVGPQPGPMYFGDKP